MNFGQAFDKLLTTAVVIRREPWRDECGLALRCKQLVWLTENQTGFEPCSGLPPADMLATDWEVVT